MARGYVAWCPVPDLIGITVTGKLDREEVEEVLTLFDEPAPPGLAEQVDLVFDCRTEPADRQAFEQLLAGLAARGGVVSPRVKRQAFVRPASGDAAFDGMTARIGGLAWEVHHSMGAALDWLERADLRPAAELVDGLLGELSTSGPLATRLRAMLRAAGLRLSIQDAGRELGMAPRSLQRYLRAGGTSFREEVERTRLEVAYRLLGESELKLEAVAHRVGFRSPAHFTVFFGKRTGLTPSEWRRQRGIRRRA